MDFDLTEDQSLLADSVRQMFADGYGFDQRKAYIKSAEGWSTAMWAQYAELGLLGLPFAEADGGFGGGLTDTCLIAEQMGKALALEPWFSTVVLGGGFLRRASAEMRSELVPQVAAGECKLAFAQVERQSRYDLFDVATTARREGAGWVITGRKGMVLHGDSADRFFVTARHAGGQRDHGGIGVFMVEAKHATARGFRTVDGGRAAEVEFDKAPATLVAEEGLPMYERFHIHEQLHKALDRKVWLPSGGSLIIEHTEALTVIDVNTGKNVGTSNLEETVFRNNLEAAEEVAKQLRLRDIGGIVVIDFIDMEIKDNRRKVVDSFRSALARDKTRTQVFDISELGLVEMTRKRIGEGLLVNFADQCPNCEGRGLVIDHAMLD